MARFTRTLAGEAAVSGVGFFTNADVSVRFRPAAAGSGVTFARVDLPGAPTVPATIACAEELHRRTGVRRGEAAVQLTEHVLAALAGLRIDDCRIEIDGPELPGLDGSALPFAEALGSAGVRETTVRRATLTVTEPVTATAGEASVTASPRSGGHVGLRVGYELDCGAGHPVPRQSFAASLGPFGFEADLAPARTFIAAAEIPALRAAGYGERVDESDLLVFEPDGTVRGNAARFADEPARHKALDLIGDLALLGCDLNAAVASRRGGHALNRALCRALLAAVQTGAARWDVPPADAARDAVAGSAFTPLPVAA